MQNIIICKDSAIRANQLTPHNDYIHGNNLIDCVWQKKQDHVNLYIREEDTSIPYIFSCL